ncbi:fimbrial adhesin EcpD [Tatumella morbirosei]|uniref:fimbrial adhesin EcpD n=1 Tax=Tatumella morbirosei TaxID=642227 RepID=UPI00062A1CDA|nr:hypothetical protein [Tatumella morbirosei]
MQQTDRRYQRSRIICGSLWFLLLFSACCFPTLKVTRWPDRAPTSFVFIENSTNDTYFITPGGVIDPRLTGSNHWTSKKYTGSGRIDQQSLGYIDNGHNTLLVNGRYFDMWLENQPIAYPLLGLRCINWYKGCDLSTSMIPPRASDASGFYGVDVPAGGAKWMHGLLSDSFYYYLGQMPVGGKLSLTINTCETPVAYNAAAGQRCTEQSSGRWYQANVTYLKAAHIRFINTNNLSEILITSDGVPVPGGNSTDCKLQTINGIDGLSCKMATYQLQNSGLVNSSIRIFPVVTNPVLEAAIKRNELQFSLDGNQWKPVSGSLYYYTFEQMKKSNSLYIFFAQSLFKKMIQLGMNDINTQKFLSFYLKNASVPESGWYEFPASNTIRIKPADLSVSIISDDYSPLPVKTGQVGAGKPSLNFGYLITTSGKTAADSVAIKVTGPQVSISGKSYCLFTSADGKLQVPFPGWITFTSRNGNLKRLPGGCDSQWHDITEALWQPQPWQDSYGNQGMINKTRITFSLPMDDPRSQLTIDNQNWFGDVSSSGEIHVKATWKNLP